MKNLFILFILLFLFSCQPEVEFTAGTENRLTGIVDFGSFSADFNSDGEFDSGGGGAPANIGGGMDSMNKLGKIMEKSPSMS